ncbi:MAG: hypothetical protein JXP34_17525 [Planctomycetes bacterium]|nr:hypothetical protein [Planctomycetota bacterium]
MKTVKKLVIAAIAIVILALGGALARGWLLAEGRAREARRLAADPTDGRPGRGADPKDEGGIVKDTPKRLALVGASVGRAWGFPEIGGRLGISGIAFEYHGVPDFDKTKMVESLLARADDRPGAIILKECAGYFPGPFDRYRALMVSWIDRCLEAGVTPIPTTVVPVTRTHGSPRRELVAKYLLGRERRIDGVLAYNGWIRAYARSRKLLLLDLEAALCEGDGSRWLRQDLAAADGLHLNEGAYRLLDREVPGLLAGLGWVQ